ncbi:hypothetical protein DSCO28_73680 (plasmid) [Desulfosarcina ovata subsp. sediminis]|uniref:Uncharacterized protein n=1 Tax=Desulfosarcina ovata subsp. sediminis TaxID=885957 RepID=A0A5K8A2Q8_9BACT|nr:hypothetical protein [Desulfosarcina ovata]BBO86802.1 hypothetical protein DSCO28_73680 [Desulfosarcina ovata subsp. sediminis]
MNTLEFISKVVESIAWPFVFVVLILLLKEPIKNIFPFIERLKVKDFELNFRRQAEETMQSIIGVDSSIERVDIEKLNMSPMEAVLMAWKKLEEAAEIKYLELEPKLQKKKFGPDHALGYFEYMGTLVPETKKALSELRLLRNQAMLFPKEAVSEDGANAFVGAANKIRKQIEAISAVTKIKLTTLSYVLFEINAVLDTGKYDHISIDDIHREIENGTVLRFIAKEAAEDIDLSLILDRDSDELNFEKTYTRHLQSIYGGYAGQERRKWGVENKGLCLLIAWTIEIIQRGSGWQANEDIA